MGDEQLPGDRQRRSRPYEWAARPVLGGPAPVSDEAWAQLVEEALARSLPGADREVGRRLRLVREDHILTQRDAATVLPLDQSKISRVEVGRRRLGFMEAVEIALRMRIPLHALAPAELGVLLDELVEHPDPTEPQNS